MLYPPCSLGTLHKADELREKLISPMDAQEIIFVGLDVNNSDRSIESSEPIRHEGHHEQEEVYFDNCPMSAASTRRYRRAAA